MSVLERPLLASLAGLVLAAPLSAQILAPAPSLPVLVQQDGTLYAAPLEQDGGLGRVLVTAPVPETLQPISVHPLVDDGWLAVATFEEEGESHLSLLAGDRRGGLTYLPSPPSRSGGLRREPVPLLDRGTLVGLAWLEGDRLDRMEVRSAVWSSGRWSAPLVVSGRAPGTQIALSGAVLEDGSWVLVWSAHDGNDDEILYAVRRQESWTEPRRVHPPNGTPDITPSVSPFRGGARLVWSRFEEGHYRLKLATLRAGRWSSAKTLAEPGSVLPVFDPGGEGRRILFRSVRPYGWTVLELDADDIPRRRAQFPDVLAGDRQMPIVQIEGLSVSVNWPLRGKRLSRFWEPVL